MTVCGGRRGGGWVRDGEGAGVAASEPQRRVGQREELLQRHGVGPIQVRLHFSVVHQPAHLAERQPLALQRDGPGNIRPGDLHFVVVRRHVAIQLVCAAREVPAAARAHDA